MWQELAMLIATGLVTFGAVFLGVVMASKRERYARHVDQLKIDAVAALERWASEVALGFSVHGIGFNTLDERDPKELEGFQRRHYWDVPEAFHRPWDPKDQYVVSLAAQHWPDLANWELLTKLGQITYHSTGIVHQALVHLWDDADLPPQQEARTAPGPSPLDFPELNLATTTPGIMARRCLPIAIDDLARDEPESLLTVSRENDVVGVYGFGNLLAVFPDESSAEKARSQAANQLSKSGAAKAARQIAEYGGRIEEMADTLHETTLAELYRADATGTCQACTRVAPWLQRRGKERRPPAAGKRIAITA